jgi:hypothetical protein
MFLLWRNISHDAELTFQAETFRNYFSWTSVILDSSKKHSSWKSKIYSSVVITCSVKVPGKVIIPSVLGEGS